MRDVMQDVYERSLLPLVMAGFVMAMTAVAAALYAYERWRWNKGICRSCNVSLSILETDMHAMTSKYQCPRCKRTHTFNYETTDL